MADVFTTQKRSEVMSRIKSKNNRDTELLFASMLRQHRISGWRRHLPITGRPDFAFKRLRVAIFIDGCFWHCCRKCFIPPATNREFWETKFQKNRKRDKFVNRSLKADGWRIVRIWEHELLNVQVVMRKLSRRVPEIFD